MSDLRLTWNGWLGGDFVIEANDLAIDDGLETAVSLSLLLDKRAPADAAIPDGSTDRRGWWANSLADVLGDEYGSLLWLLSRAKTGLGVLLLAEQYAEEALAWMKADRIASAIDVKASFPSFNTLQLDVAITKPDSSVLNMQYALPWGAQSAEAA